MRLARTTVVGDTHAARYAQRIETQRVRLLEICERTPVTAALRAGVAIETRLRSA